MKELWIKLTGASLRWYPQFCGHHMYITVRFRAVINNRAYGRDYQIQFDYIESYQKGW